MTLKQARLNISKHGSGYLHKRWQFQDSDSLRNITFPLDEKVWQLFDEVVASIFVLNKDLNKEKVARLLIHSLLF